MNDFHPTTTTYKQGAKTLPGRFYTSEAIFNKEIEQIFTKSWCCAGRADTLGKPGDFRVVDVAGESIIIVRDSGNILHAFFNVCRHRGTQICNTGSGHFAAHMQCPYHAWTYDTSGKLVAAPHMFEAADFNTSDYGLHEAALTQWEGFLFINIARKPETFSYAWKTMFGRLKRFGLDRLTTGKRVVYDIRSNWKLVFQNYNECLHCPSIHPELSRVLPFQSGANDLTRGRILGGYMVIKPPNESATMSGMACGRLISDDIPNADRMHAYYYTFMPNFMLSIHPDYVNYYIIKPVSTGRTIVESEWLFPAETIAAKKNNIAGAVDFWDRTNRQDWDIIERSQLGISSRRYVPGPYSPRESIPAAWDREYLRMMKYK